MKQGKSKNNNKQSNESISEKRKQYIVTKISLKEMTTVVLAKFT